MGHILTHYQVKKLKDLSETQERNAAEIKSGRTLIEIELLITSQGRFPPKSAI